MLCTIQGSLDRYFQDSTKCLNLPPTIGGVSKLPLEKVTISDLLNEWFSLLLLKLPEDPPL